MITIIAVGKMGASPAGAVCDDYIKRTNRFVKLSIAELSETPHEDIEKKLDKEAALIMRAIPKGAFVILCDVNAPQMSSEAFAETLRSLYNEGKSNVCFIIGGSNGVDEKVRGAADMRISFSKMTFAHKLFRVMLSEQLYRAHKIMAGETYHK